MKALSFCEQFCPEKIEFNKLGKWLGDGSDGEVFLTDKPNIVIKFCILYNNINEVNKQYWGNTAPLLNYLISNPIDIFARVYAHEYMGTFPQDFRDVVLYSYTMEKLEDISEAEKKVFHTILSHEDRGIVKNYSIKEVQEILQGLSLGLDFDENKVIFFYKNLKKSNINHADIHPRNIMKDKEGNFKMIDFDRAQLNGE